MRKFLPVIFLLLLFTTQFIAADEPDSSVNDSIRIERMAGVCRLWGVAKYFHPYLAYKSIDWDEALIKTIPLVNKADTADEYKQAVQYLLSFLKDPNTYIVDDNYVFPPSIITDWPVEEYYPPVIWTDDSIAIIAANDFARRPDFQNLTEQDEFMNYVVDKAKAIIIDIRSLNIPTSNEGRSDPGSWIKYALRSWISIISRVDAILPSIRYRVHTSDVNPGTARHLSGFMYRDEYILGAKREGPDSLPVVFILNEGSADLLPLLGGVQDSKQAAIIFEGPFDREGGIDTYEVLLPDSIKVEVRLTEVVRRDGTESIHPDLVIPFATDTTLLDCPPIRTAIDIIHGKREAPPVIGNFLAPLASIREEKTYGEMAYLKMEYRMLALFRFWNDVRYFHPFIDDLEQSWDAVLLEMIPIFESAKAENDYFLAVRQLANRLHDSNINISPGIEYDDFPACAVGFIEGKTVVTYLEENRSKSTSGLEIGDIILEVDGEDIALRRDRLARHLSASTQQAMQWNINAELLGSKNPVEVTLTVEKADGEIREIMVGRPLGTSPRPDCLPSFLEIGEGIKYINKRGSSLSWITDSLEMILDSDGLIFDFRDKCAGSVFYNDYLHLIKQLAGKETAAFQTGAIERHTPAPDKYSWAYQMENIVPDENSRFMGDVVVLIDPSTMGFAEIQCLYLKAATSATLIGMSTNGTPGGLRNIILPGQIHVSFTSAEVKYPDGRPVHGLGIQPDIQVEPTVEGIREGRDEILEAAIEFLKISAKK